MIICNHSAGARACLKNHSRNLPGEFIEDTAKEWVQHIHPADQHIFLEDIGRIFEGKSNRHNCEYRALNKYGKYVWVRCQVCYINVHII